MVICRPKFDSRNDFIIFGVNLTVKIIVLKRLLECKEIPEKVYKSKELHVLFARSTVMNLYGETQNDDILIVNCNKSKPLQCYKLNHYHSVKY